MTGSDLIAIERQRQVDVEGYDSDHDEGHADELALAGATYALPIARRSERTTLSGEGISLYGTLDVRARLWPWGESYWKPSFHRTQDGKIVISGGDDSGMEPDDPRRITKPTANDLRVRELVKAGALIAAAIDSLRGESR